ncbi:MAG TPA: hypothetical protein VF175_17245 [Lacipirellula sp.]
MATVLVAMLGYAVLFAGMLLLDAGPGFMGVLASFFAFIAVAQAIAIRWNNPREASILGGALFWAAWMVWSLSRFWWGLDVCSLGAGAFCGAALGMIFGYMAGALVGGVFLVSHYLRQSQLLHRRTSQSEASKADSPWEQAAGNVDHASEREHPRRGSF